MLGQNAKQNEEQKFSGSEASCVHGCSFAVLSANPLETVL